MNGKRKIAIFMFVLIALLSACLIPFLYSRLAGAWASTLILQQIRDSKVLLTNIVEENGYFIRTEIVAVDRDIEIVKQEVELPYAESTGETNDHYFSYGIGAPNPENGSHVPLFLVYWAGFLTNGSFFEQYEFSQDCFSVDLFTYIAFVQFQEYAVYLKQVDDALNGDRDVTLTVRETCWPSWN